MMLTAIRKWEKDVPLDFFNSANNKFLTIFFLIITVIFSKLNSTFGYSNE